MLSAAVRTCSGATSERSPSLLGHGQDRILIVEVGASGGLRQQQVIEDEVGHVVGTIIQAERLGRTPSGGGASLGVARPRGLLADIVDERGKRDRPEVVDLGGRSLHSHSSLASRRDLVDQRGRVAAVSSDREAVCEAGPAQRHETRQSRHERLEPACPDGFLEGRQSRRSLLEQVCHLG